MESGSETSTMLSIYESLPLDDDRIEIRMLTIIPGSPESIVECTLDKTDLLNPTRYSALSYCWGGENIRTDILVNNAKTSVTVNLVEALQQLRRLGVSRVWVDALCINQKDRREKSNQIRIMKHIYSRARETYAWLCKQELESTLSPIEFLRIISLDKEYLSEVPHSHELQQNDNTSSTTQSTTWWSGILAHRQIEKSIPQTASCQRCVLEPQFQTLLDFFNLDYWKRRWIIQEIAVAPSVQIVYGQESMTLVEMTKAIKRCRMSCYWLPQFEKAYEYIKVITEFRHSYQAENNLPLCTDIFKTRRSLSKDPHDRVFALLGICSDGAELVPTPSYYQDPHLISRDITMSLIRKNKRLDLISSVMYNPTSEGLPTWSPDWLSPDLAEDAHLAANMRLTRTSTNTGRDIYHNIDYGNVLHVDGNRLQVEGVVIGSIANITSALEPGKISQDECSTGYRESSSGLAPVYYECRNDILQALLRRLSIFPEEAKMSVQELKQKPTTMKSIMFPFPLFFPIRIYRFLMSHIMPPQFFLHGLSEASDLESSNAATVLSRRVLQYWIQINQSFSIHGKSLEGWLTESQLRKYVVRIVCSYTGFFVVCFICLCISAVLLFSTILVFRVLTSSYEFFFSLCFSILICYGWFSLFFCMSLKYLFDVPTWRAHWYGVQSLLEYLGKTGSLSKKLIVSERGFIGMTFSEAEVSDQICFLVGCQNAVLLRGFTTEGQLQHRVVGEVIVFLSNRDEEKYGAFVEGRNYERDGYVNGKVRGVRPSLELMIMREQIYYDNQIRRYRQKGLIQKFDFV